MGRFDDLDDEGRSPSGCGMRTSTERWRARKGRSKLREFRDALFAVPGHRLVDGEIATLDGEVCGVGAYAAFKRTQRGQTWAEATAELNQEFHPVPEPRDWQRNGAVTLRDEDPYPTDAFETQYLGMRECGLNRTLAWHLAYLNDEQWYATTPEERWQKAWDWVKEQLLN